jgi:2-C-methyl-D-erythritol 4-phosphate cytidylyltransferase
LKKSVIIVAGGSGMRMDSAMPKQFMLLANKPLLIYSIDAFIQAFPEILVVIALPLDFIQTWKQLCVEYQFNQPHQIVPGGETRYHSVKNALALISNDMLIAIHDGARPLVSPILINQAFSSAKNYGNAVPAVQINESLRKLSENDSQAVNRNQYRIIQTPQVFKSNLLKKAYETGFHDTFTDDATVVEKLGEKIHLIPGELTNIKITYPSDLTYAEMLLGKIVTAC